MINLFELLLAMDESSFYDFLSLIIEAERYNVFIPESIYLALSAIDSMAED